MKKILIITVIIILSVAAVSFASPGIVDTIKEVFNDNNITEVESAEKETIVTNTITALEKLDIVSPLKSKGYYEDDVSISVEKLANALVMGNMSENDIKHLVSLAEKGYDFEKLIDIYNFLLITNEGIEFVEQIYDSAPDFNSGLWIENAYESLKVQPEDMLKVEDMYYYTEKGIMVDDILMAYEMSFQGNMKIKEVLDAHLEGQEWSQIAVKGYALEPAEEILLENDLRSINRTINIARKLNSRVSDIVDSDKKIKQSILEVYSEKLDKIEKIHTSLGTASQLEIVESALQVIPSISKEEVEELIKNGYRIRDIKAALEGVDDSEKSFMIKQSLQDFRTERSTDNAE